VRSSCYTVPSSPSPLLGYHPPAGRNWAMPSGKSVIFLFYFSGTRPITEVKQLWAALVLGWVTAWEYAVS